MIKRDELRSTPSDGNPEEIAAPKKRRVREVKKPKEVKCLKEEEPTLEPLSDFSDYLRKVSELILATQGLDSECVEDFVRDLAGKFGFSGSDRWVEGETLMLFNKTVLKIHSKLSSKQASILEISEEYLQSAVL